MRARSTLDSTQSNNIFVYFCQLHTISDCMYSFDVNYACQAFYLAILLLLLPLLMQFV